MKLYTALSAATFYAALAGLSVDASEARNLRRLTSSAPQANARPMLRGFTMTEQYKVQAPPSDAITEEETSGVRGKPQTTAPVGVSWVPSDFRTGKVSLLPTFPPTAPTTLSDTPVMVPSVVPAVTHELDVSWFSRGYRTESEALLRAFAPKPTPAPTTAPIGVSWMPSDFRTGNVTRLPIFSHSPATESSTPSAESSVQATPVGVSWMPSDLRTGNVTRLPLFPPAPTASRNPQAERDQ